MTGDNIVIVRAVRTLIAVSLVLVVAGCGSSTSSTTIAQVCKSHPNDEGTIAGGVFAFKTAMDSESTSAWPGAATVESVTTAVQNLRSAASHVGSTEAVSTFLDDLQEISKFLNDPPTFPTALAGNLDTSKWESAAKQVDCPL